MKKLVNEHNYEKYFIIMEDDVYPTDLFDSYYDKIINFINNDNRLEFGSQGFT